MEMLLRHTTQAELTTLLRNTSPASPIGHLLAPDAQAFARQLAQDSDIWKRLPEKIAPDEPVEIFTRSAYRQYQRTGSRKEGEAQRSRRLTRLRAAATALWLQHPVADIDFLQDLLWAYCDDWTWVMAAHERHPDPNDLGSTGLATTLAE
ncbi:MAG: hypothetical protein D6820_13180, partial [Lentisphaerae bacterium]